MQYSLKLSSTSQNPAYSGVFNGKFKSAFDRKPNQIPPLGIRVEPDLHAIGYIVQSSITVTPPWLLDHPRVNLDLRCFHKRRTLLRRFTEADFTRYVPTMMTFIDYIRTVQRFVTR